MKSKLIILLFINLLLNGCANSGTISGYWLGSIGLNGKTVDLSINLNSDKQTFSSSDLMLLEQPITNLKINNGNVFFSLVLDVELHFKGTLKNDQINGTIEMQNGPPNMNMVFNLIKQTKTPEKSYSIENLTIKSGSIVISADFYKQKGKGKFPTLILLHGSSTNLKSDYVFDADFFAKLGFEVLIYDKRGNGKSTGNYYTSNYDDLITDAIACLETIKRRESVDKNKIGLWGYSQGAMLLPRIITKTDIPSFLIAKSPGIVSVVEAAAYSDSLRVVNSGNSKSNGHIAANSHRVVEKMINNGANYKEVEDFIQRNAQEYSFMNQTGLYEGLNIDKDEFAGFYWKGRTENFYTDWESINIPTLVLLGERDDLVDANKNKLLLNNLSNEYIEVVFFPLANHHLKKTFNPTIDSEFDFPRLIEGYSENIEKWIENK
ncbi:MAG: alpha/beta fold hydrolase [Salinivirgaceae bacterium]